MGKQDARNPEHRPGIPVLAVATGFVSPSRRLRCQLTLSGRSFKQAPRSQSSCERAGGGGDWAGCKADKAIALVGCIASQLVVFHLKPQLLHLARTPVEAF